MKKKTMRMLSAALAVTLLSGCGAAQTNTPAETSVNQAMLLEKSAQPQESAYTFPEKFTGDWTGQEGKLTITRMPRWWQSWARRCPRPRWSPGSLLRRMWTTC